MHICRSIPPRSTTVVQSHGFVKGAHHCALTGHELRTGAGGDLEEHPEVATSGDGATVMGYSYH